MPRFKYADVHEVTGTWMELEEVLARRLTGVRNGNAFGAKGGLGWRMASWFCFETLLSSPQL